jgi:gluconolactonase
MSNDFRILAEGLDHPEAVAWGVDGRIWAGGEAGQVYAISLEGAVEEVASTGGFVLGLALDGDGRVYVCDMIRKEVLRILPGDGAVERYSAGTRQVPMRAPNYPAFDAEGNLYVTDSGEWDGSDGCIFRVTPRGETTVWSTEARRFPNQCCLAAEGDSLLVVESNLPGVSRVPIRPDGSAGTAEILVELPGTVPDGVAALAEGGAFFVSCYRPDRIYHVTAAGRTEVLLDDPLGQVLNQPTSLAFVGERLDQLAVANLGGWHLSIGEPGVVGAQAAHPKLP